jgi:hypothetical protein
MVRRRGVITPFNDTIMKMSDTPKMEKVEQTFAVVAALVVLLILPIWGAVPMLVGSAIGLVVYAVLFRAQLRSRGLLKVVVIPVGIAVAAAAIAFALQRGHGH